MIGGFGSVSSSLKDKQRQAVLRLLNFNSVENGEHLTSTRTFSSMPILSKTSKQLHDIHCSARMLSNVIAMSDENRVGDIDLVSCGDFGLLCPLNVYVVLPSCP